ncbi:hypothetical protein Tco_0026766 [Tanacetum coccineum]
MMHQQRQSLRLSKANEEKNSGIIDSNAESPSTVSKSQPKKSSQSFILEKELEQEKQSNVAYGSDVVGTVVAIGNIVAVNGYGCSKFRHTVVIEEAQSLRLECTFWDNWPHMWNEYAKKLDQVGHLDIVMIVGKIKYWNSK